MNRLSPLVRRRIRPRANIRVAASGVPIAGLDEAARWLDDAKLFATGWVAGLVVFGTLFA